ncbi:MAG: ATP-binding protein [Limnochordia bacterium]|nr:ATP-binding protein [Limnochordia bacterium]
MSKKPQSPGQVDWFVFALILTGTSLALIAELRWVSQTWTTTGVVPYVMVLVCLVLVGALFWFFMNYAARVRYDSELRLELQRLKAQEELNQQLAGQSHEFKNQITVIHTMLQMGKVEQSLEYIESISGKKHVSMGTGGSAFFSTLSAKMTRAYYHHVQFEVCLKINPVSLYHPDNAIVCLLGNLCDNAIEAAAKEPAEEGRVKLSLYADPQAGCVVTEVWNNGAYIDEAHLKDIFKPGFTDKELAGHGYGLWLVYSTVEELGGRITVESSQEAGTVFRLLIPASSVVLCS